MKEKFYLLLDILFHILSPSDNKILFSSFHGQYNDNPKYISEEIHRRFPKIELYWVLSEKSKCNDIPEYINVLHYNTLKYCWMKNRCKVIVENGAGYYLFTSAVLKFDIKRLLKNKKQFDLSTWHGNPIKCIGAQIPGNESWSENTLYTTSDVLLAGANMIGGIFKKAFLNKMPVELLGTARTDILFMKDEVLKNKIKQKLGLPLDKKVILYAPTYRNNASDSGVKQMQNIDFNILFDALNQKYGGEWVFVFRVHNMVLLSIDTESLSRKYGERIIDGNRFDDMAEYLFTCDALLSDYSGCIFDVALTDKPCFLYAHDKKEYEGEERGFYFSIAKFPYDFSESFDELIECIKNYDEIDIAKRRKLFLDYIGNVEDGKAAKRAADLVLCKLNERYMGI